MRVWIEDDELWPDLIVHLEPNEFGVPAEVEHDLVVRYTSARDWFREVHKEMLAVFREAERERR